MRDTIDDLGTGSFGRYLGVGTTDIVSGSYVYFKSTISFDKMKSGVKGSMAKAGIFPYIAYSTWKLIDGGIKYSVDILHGIDACNTMGYEDKDIMLDVILSNGKKIDVIDASKYKSLQVLFRYLDISTYGNAMQEVLNAQHDHPDITLRHLVYPSQKITGSIYPYDFSTKQLEEMVDLGVADAKAAVQG